MGAIFLLVGLVFSILMFAAAIRLQDKVLRAGASAIGLLFLFLAYVLGSIQYIGSGEVGIVSKNAFGARLPGNKIIATEGEMGVQAQVLSPGWHVGYFPIIYSVHAVPLTEIKNDEVGLIETSDGQPMAAGELFAPEFAKTDFQQMLDAEHFLTKGKGFKGKQTSVLTPGKYRLNSELYKIHTVKQTEVLAGEVAVLKSNFGKPPTQQVKLRDSGADQGGTNEEHSVLLAKSGEMGILFEPLPPGKYPLNTDAFTVTELWTTQMIAHYTASSTMNPASESGRSNAPASKDVRHHDSSLEEREITVRTSDGFTFPVDVRVEYVIEPADAPIVVAKLGDDEGDRFRNALNSAVRAIFRNNGESVRAMDYVQQRSHQEEQSFKALRSQMARFGITVTAVRIGNVGDEKSLGKLLETQTQREIAKQEQLTTQEQQKAAEQKKLLAKATQESEEEKKLATATYSVKIATETQKQKVAEAEGEAQATQIKAKAQAEAYRQIAEQIGKSNAAMLEMLKIVGEKQIQITPRIMMTGGSGASSTGHDGMTPVLMGTILDNMMSKEEEEKAKATPPKAASGTKP